VKKCNLGEVGFNKVVNLDVGEGKSYHTPLQNHKQAPHLFSFSHEVIVDIPLSLWRMASATWDLWLPSQPRSI